MAELPTGFVFCIHFLSNSSWKCCVRLQKLNWFVSSAGIRWAKALVACTEEWKTCKVDFTQLIWRGSFNRGCSIWSFELFRTTTSRSGTELLFCSSQISFRFLPLSPKRSFFSSLLLVIKHFSQKVMPFYDFKQNYIFAWVISALKKYFSVLKTQLWTIKSKTLVVSRYCMLLLWHRTQLKHFIGSSTTILASDHLFKGAICIYYIRILVKNT